MVITLLIRDCMTIINTVETVDNTVCFSPKYPRLKSWVNDISLFLIQSLCLTVRYK